MSSQRGIRQSLVGKFWAYRQQCRHSGCSPAKNQRLFQKTWSVCLLVWECANFRQTALHLTPNMVHVIWLMFSLSGTPKGLFSRLYRYWKVNKSAHMRQKSRQVEVTFGAQLRPSKVPYTHPWKTREVRVCKL